MSPRGPTRTSYDVTFRYEPPFKTIIILRISTKVQKMISFEDEMLDVMNKAALALLLSVGHRTKLFDSMAKLAPSTSQEIATAASLNERYVRE